MLIEIGKFIMYSGLIVLISKYVLVKNLRKLAESINVEAKAVGNIAGYATSIPEFLTIVTSSSRGLVGASVYNIISSNIINLIQYFIAIVKNKNVSKLKNKAIKLDIILVLVTIILPLILVRFNIEMDLFIVPIFIILYALFVFLNNNAHKLYLRNEDKILEEEIEEEKKWEKGKTLKYIVYLLIAGILLFIVGELLGYTLENLCEKFGVKEFVIGIFLGGMTSLPELITFFESQKHYKKEENEMLGVVEATNNLLTSNVINLYIIGIVLTLR